MFSTTQVWLAKFESEFYLEEKEVAYGYPAHTHIPNSVIHRVLVLRELLVLELLMDM